MAEIIQTTTTELLVVEEFTNNQLVDGTQTTTLTITEQSPTLLEVAQQGPAGPQGSGMQSEQYLANYPIGGNRAVTVNSLGRLEYPDIASESSFIIGITKTSAQAGALCEVQILGTQQEPSWTWQPGQLIYVGNLGVLTQTPPSSGQLIVVGYALTATTIMIDKQSNIYRT